MARQLEAPPKATCKAHIKDICYSRMYITNHFDAPFEHYTLDTATADLVSGTGVPRSALLPLTCFLFKGYLFTLNNRRLWVLRHSFIFTGKDEDIDIIVLPDSALPERKDYVSRLPFHKQEALVSPGFNPTIHGHAQPRLQKLIMRPIVYRFDMVLRNGYKLLPGGRLLCINATEAALAFQASGVKLPPQGLVSKEARKGPGSVAGDSAAAEDDDDTRSMTSETPSMMSVDYPGRPSDLNSSTGRRLSFGLPVPRLALPALQEDNEEEETEGKALAGGKKEELAEAAKKFKTAVASLRVVLDSLDEAFDKLAA